MTDYPFKLQPYKHQLDCWERSRDAEAHAILFEMRCGKTKVTIDTIAWLYDQGKIDGALILAPKGNYRDWLDIEDDGQRSGQVMEHMPAHIRPYATYWTSYQTKYMLQTYKLLFQPSNRLHILVMNTEALSHKTGTEFARKFLSTHTALMAVDESTMIKNDSKRTKSVLALGALAKYRRILSGRIITRAPLDAYHQFMFLDWRILGFGSYFAFRNRYAILQKIHYIGRKPFTKVVGYQRTEELTTRIAKYSSRVRQDQCSDIPEKTYQYHHVELSPEQEKIYAQMRDLAIANLETTIVTAPMVMVRLQKLHEIVCGYIKDPLTGGITEIPNNRHQAVLDILERTDRKVIIWSTQTYDIEKLYRLIAAEYGPETVAKYHGDTSADDRQDIKKRFQNPDDPLRFFIGNQATGKFGLTLTEAKVMIYYANDHNLENRLQSEERSQYLAQRESLLVIDLLTKNTVDELYVTSMRTKKDMSDLIMGDGYRKWL